EVRQQVGEAAEGGAVVVGGEADEGVHLGGAAEEPEVVAGHHAALGVADEVGLGGAGRAEHFVDEGGGVLCPLGERAEGVEDGEAVRLAVVEGEDAVTAVLRVRGEGQPVVDGVAQCAVDQDHGAGVGGGGVAGVVVPAGAGGARRMGGGGGNGGD